MRVVTCLGDAKDPATHSGTTYHFWRNGAASGFLDEGWSLAPERLRWQRYFWNLQELCATGRYGGFQFSTPFNDALLDQAPNHSEAREIISFFPLFPAHSRITARLSFYIDATLAQVFRDYGYGSTISPRVARAALARERAQYANAQHIVCMSEWAARSIVDDTGVSPERVHVVPPGPNLDEQRIPPLAARGSLGEGPLRLGFVGKDWRRKNLAFLLEVAEWLTQRGRETEVWAIGFSPERGPKHSRLRALGFIDKHRDQERFVELVRNTHFSCLFSSAEAFGISNLEALRLGVPVLARDVGGIADTLPLGLGHLFPSDVEVESVARRLLDYVTFPERYDLLRRTVAERAQEHSWATCIRRFEAIWSGSDAHTLAQVSKRSRADGA